MVNHSSYTAQLATLVTVTLLGLGCSDPAQISGQVFVVTEGRENIELGLVNVRAIPADAVDQHLDERYEKAREHVKELAAQVDPKLDSIAHISRSIDSLQAKKRTLTRKISSLNQKVEEAKSRLSEEASRRNHNFASGDEVAVRYDIPFRRGPSTTEPEIRELSPGTIGVVQAKDDPFYKVEIGDQEGWVLDLYLVNRSTYQKLESTQDQARPQIQEAEARKEGVEKKLYEVKKKLADTARRARSLLSSIETYRSQSFFFSDLPNPSDSAKTDADGKFQLKVDQGTPYYLAAHATRSIVDSEEEYYWLTRVEPSSDQNTVLLSNDNMGYLTSSKYAFSTKDMGFLSRVFGAMVDVAKADKPLDWDEVIYRASFPQDSSGEEIPDIVEPRTEVSQEI